MKPKKVNGVFVFNNYPDFTPNLSPSDIFKLGSFGGTYWRPIYSSVIKKKLKNQHLKYPKSWWKNIPNKCLTNEWDNYDININKYKKKVGTTLDFWENKNWITKYHPYGWVQWYCDFFIGKRSIDDERQIKRWKNFTGLNGRFKKNLIGQIFRKNAKYNDYSISPVIRQSLQHWAYKLTKKDYLSDIKLRNKNNKITK